MPSAALALLGISVGFAEPNSFGATVSSTARVGLDGCASTPATCSWLSFNDSAVLSPWALAKPSATVVAKGSFDLRINGVHQSESNEQAQPFQASTRLTDAWVSMRSSHTDLTLGVQRVSWGVGQGYSLIDTINPLNLDDPTQFDQRLSVLAAHASLYSGHLDASAVIVPFFVPAALPVSGVALINSGSDFFDDQFSQSTSLELGSVTTRTSMPTNTVRDTSIATRIRYTPAAGDFALSWHRGRDSLPQANGALVLIGFQTVEGRVDVGVPLEFPKRDILGFSARTTLPGDVTSWIEVTRTVAAKASVAPSEAQMEGLVNVGAIESVPDPIPYTVTQDGTPVFHWLLGADRSLGSLRLTAQWLHGFLTERTADEVSDYALLSAAWSATPTLRFEASGATNFSGHLFALRVTTLHSDSAELDIGATLIDGQTPSPFAALRTASNLHTTVRMRF